MSDDRPYWRICKCKGVMHNEHVIGPLTDWVNVVEKSYADSLEQQLKEALEQANKMAEALEEENVLHANESTNKTCCEMNDIICIAPSNWQKFRDKL